MDSKEIEAQVLAHENTAKYLEGKTPKKMIVVPGRRYELRGIRWAISH